MKKCSKCGNIKSLECFYVDNTRKDKRYPQCRECVLKYKEKRKIYGQTYSLSYYYENKEEIAEKKRIHRKNNPEYHRQRRLKWRKENPDKVRRNRHLRRARERGVVIGAISSLKNMLRLQGYSCAICGKKEHEIPAHKQGNVWHIDHILPISKGGSHTQNNVQVLCWPCNLSKRNKII